MAIRQDYIERMISQLVHALASILKLGTANKPDEALQVVHQTSLEVFGIEYRMLITIDAASVADLLGHPSKILALAKLVSTEAELLQQKGDLEAVTHRLTHALALAEEGQRRRTVMDPEDEALVKSVRERLARAGSGA